ncbi:MAG: fibronectin type III domain-containing protein, partial [Elusimicrobia bacterium]|nr:fibronectin type III domain-containing protein [Elusimicrobiota bacterium]
KSEDGSQAWEMTEEQWTFAGQILIDQENRIYAVGESTYYGDFYIARYLQEPEADSIAPAAVEDLRVIAVSSYSATLGWTASGDDEEEGTADSYGIAYSAIGYITTDADFNAATIIFDIPAPQIAGSNETFTVTGLKPGTTYYFALKTADEVENISELSNSPQGVTASTPAGKYSITKSDGDNQIVVVNTHSDSLVSLVNIFESTQTAENIAVNFTTSTFPAGATGWELTLLSTNTDENGLASTRLMLGNIPAEYGVTATCPSCVPSASSVTFTCCGKLKNDDFKQFSNIWKNEPYNNQNSSYAKTIGSVGCSLTAMATLVNYYADVHPELKISTTNPKDLNSKLKPAGFDKGHNLSFEAVSFEEISKGNIVYNNEKSSNYNLPLTASSVEKIGQFLDNELLIEKRPGMVRIYRSKFVYNPKTNKNEKKEGKHFMLVIGKCGDKYIVSDPGSGGRILFGINEINVSSDWKKDTFGPIDGIRRFNKK